MFLTPRFVPKTIEELRGQGTDAAELARQEARLKQQVHCARTGRLSIEMLFQTHDGARRQLWKPCANTSQLSCMTPRQ